MEQEQSTLTSTHQYTLLHENTDKVNRKVIIKDGKPCYCHKLPPYGIPGSMGGVELERWKCGTDCPRAEIKKNESGRSVYVTNCEIHETSFLLATEEEVKKSGITTKNTGALIAI